MEEHEENDDHGVELMKMKLRKLSVIPRRVLDIWDGCNVIVIVSVFDKSIRLDFEVQFVKTEFCWFFYYIKLIESWVVIFGLILICEW